jgi:imidazolonepropionase-like amidohydrolase
MIDVLLLTKATVIDCTGSDPIEDVCVVLDGDRIVDIAKEPPASTAYSTLDCRGHYVLPGLIDAHVHIGGVEHASGQHRRNSTAYLAFRIAERMKTMLDAGFTTVRDAGGGEIGFKQAVDHGLTTGPRLILSMRALTQTGGHGDPRSASEPGDHYYEGEFGMTNVIADGADEVRRATREQLRRGADTIKVIASGGAVSPGSLDSTQYSVDELKTIVSEASAAGRRVMAHALPPPAIRNCIEAGVHSIEHGNFLDAETAALMRERDVYLVPTLLAYEHDAEFGEKYGYSATVREKLVMGAEHGREALATAVAAGVKVGSGSDMIGPAVALMGQEIASQGEVMGRYAALMASTRVNADLCDLGDELGTVEVGKIADLVVTRKNPLDDLTVLGSADRIEAVIKAGKVVRSNIAVTK